MNVWRLMTHHKDFHEESLEWMTRGKFIALGWGRAGLVGPNDSSGDLCRSIRTAYKSELANERQGGACLYHFRNTLAEGDLVILATDTRRAAVMRVTGPYRFKVDVHSVREVYDYQNLRDAVEVPVDPNRLWQASGGRTGSNGQNIRRALFRLARVPSPDLFAATSA